MDLEPLKDKFLSFNWNVIVVDGHDHSLLKKNLEKKKNQNSRPTCIIANTIKGKGVSYMENNNLWHYRCPNEEEFKQAMYELNN